MSRKSTARGIGLLLGAFSLASWGYGEEAGDAQVRHGAVVAVEEAAASIGHREIELALRERSEVLGEVRKRARELGISASAEVLTDLLEQRAHLDIELEKCRLGLGGTSALCDEMKTTLADVERSFRQKTGLSMREFRSGARDAPARDLARAEVGIRNLTANSQGDTCTCAFTVYSQDRWMNRYWGLECNNHGSHGVCSNDVDSAHSPGTGSMTGDIDLYFGGNHAHRDCPDDHQTCFRGPSTDHAGAWGNTCSCDTWHSQYYNPYIQWYGGDLADAATVYQLSTGWMTTAGACGEVYVAVKEFIKENDPWCCDDPMGDLWAYLPLANGLGMVTGPASAQNCNGGSQSGVYPYCGTFGATIRIDYNCSTYSPPPPPECDPEAVQSCYDMGWYWDAETCSCTRCQPPPPNCPYWDDFSCLCYAN